LAWVGLFLTAAVGAQPASSSTRTATTPEELLAREIELPEARNQVGTSSFAVTVPATLLESPRWLELGWAMKFDIGTAVPILCAVHDKALDLATILDYQIEGMHDDAMKASAAGESSKRQRRLLADVDAGAVAGHPFLAAEWLLMGDQTTGDRASSEQSSSEQASGEEDGSAIASDRLPILMTKHRVAEVDGHTVSCGHHEIGYRETFRSFFEQLVLSLEPRQPQVDEQIVYQEIQAVRINGLRIGFVHTTISRDQVQEDGTLWLNEASSSYLPAPEGGAARARDSLKLSLVAPTGELIRSTLLEREAITYKLDLQKVDGVWTLIEKIGGRETTSQLGNVPLGSFLSWARQIGATLNSGELRTLYGEEWQPLTNPKRFTRRKLEWPESASAGEALVSEGAVTGRAWFDPSGSSRRAVASHQGITVELERVYQSGSLP
jgi:hypothetical protein